MTKYLIACTALLLLLGTHQGCHKHMFHHNHYDGPGNSENAPGQIRHRQNGGHPGNGNGNPHR